MEEFEIREILRTLGCRKVRRTHGNMLSTCPFESNHKNGKDKNPSFTIEITPAGEKSRWNCFACGEKGASLASLRYRIKQALGVDLDLIDEGLTEYTPRIQIDPGWKPMKNRWWKAGKELNLKFEDFACFYPGDSEYAKKRGLSIEQIDKWKLGFDRSRNRLFIPIFDHEGRMVGHSSRATLPGQEPKYYHAPGFQKEKYLYGESLWDLSIDTACLSEGFFDVWNLDKAGLPNPLAFFGTGVGDDQLWKLAKRFKRVLLFPHNDPPGKNGERPGSRMAMEWKSALEQVGIQVTVVPVLKGKKDVGDWLIKEIRYVVGEHLKLDSLFDDGI